MHAQSQEQLEETTAYFKGRASEGKPIAAEDVDNKDFLSDKLVALEPEKAQFCYQLCRAMNVKLAVEAGTSYGVSTLYLAAALRDNARSGSGNHVVIGTEYEPRKAAIARAHFEEAALQQYIELREGDLRETLLKIDGEVDFALIDIWIPMARPALELIVPRLRSGGIVVCDNTSTYRDEYKNYFTFIADPRNRLRTMTVPFLGGLELTVRV